MYFLWKNRQKTICNLHIFRVCAVYFCVFILPGCHRSGGEIKSVDYCSGFSLVSSLSSFDVTAANALFSEKSIVFMRISDVKCDDEDCSLSFVINNDKFNVRNFRKSSKLCINISDLSYPKDEKLGCSSYSELVDLRMYDKSSIDIHGYQIKNPMECLNGDDSIFNNYTDSLGLRHIIKNDYDYYADVGIKE